MFSPKSTCVGGWCPLQRGLAPPPNGKSWIRPCYLCRPFITRNAIQIINYFNHTVYIFSPNCKFVARIQLQMCTRHYNCECIVSVFCNIITALLSQEGILCSDILPNKGSALSLNLKPYCLVKIGYWFLVRNYEFGEKTLAYN